MFILLQGVICVFHSSVAADDVTGLFFVSVH